MPLYEYQCKPCNTVFEQFNSIPNREVANCPKCGSIAVQKIGAPMVKLEGISGDFPTAYDQWEKKRKQKMAQERKAEE